MSLNIDTSILKPSLQAAGHIYCIVNKSYKGWVKVGMSKDPAARLKNGYNAYTPEDNFYFLELEKVDHYRLAERHLIQTFSKYTPESPKEEWFQATQDRAKRYFSETVDTLEQYIHTYCIEAHAKKIQKKAYTTRKNLEHQEKRCSVRKQAKDEILIAEKKLLRALRKQEKQKHKRNTEWMDKQEELGLMFASDHCIFEEKVGDRLEPLGRFTGRIPTHMLHRYGLEKQC
jgi:hypothetical protein